MVSGFFVPTTPGLFLTTDLGCGYRMLIHAKCEHFVCVLGLVALTCRLKCWSRWNWNEERVTMTQVVGSWLNYDYSCVLQVWKVVGVKDEGGRGGGAHGAGLVAIGGGIGQYHVLHMYAESAFPSHPTARGRLKWWTVVNRRFLWFRDGTQSNRSICYHPAKKSLHWVFTLSDPPPPPRG